MALIGPPEPSANPVSIVIDDVRSVREATVPFPPGDTRFSPRRTRRVTTEPLELLLDAYERYGPVFTMRLMHQPVVFMIGPEANHYILVSEAQNFLWRDGHFRELIGLLGDGLLTIDGDFHRSSRQIMLPAFHRQQIAASVDVVLDEAEQAIERWEIGQELDFYEWTRRVALRIAMRAVFGLDPDGEPARRIDAAALFTTALGYYNRDPTLRLLRGPGSPWSRMRAARKELNGMIFSEIARRRASGERGMDVLSLLLDARDENGGALSERQIRDEVMTLLFAGHDTTTSTLAFMFFELSRNPELQAPLLEEQARVLGGAGSRPTAAQLMGDGLPQLEMVFEETLRKFPPAWIGPRRSVQPFEFAGVPVPGRAFVNYSSWVSHHLPDIFPNPHCFEPERFTPERKAALPKGAYVPFGGGSRTCIGMRFGQLEIRAIATLILGRVALAVPEDLKLRIRQAPTIGPRDGLPVRILERPPVSGASADAPGDEPLAA